MPPPLLIGLSGKKQSGKSTIANHLFEKYNFGEISWAGPLKEKIGIDLMGLTPEQVYGTEEQKTTADLFWGKSPRELLQIIGTDCFRNLVHPDFWVKVGERKIQERLNGGVDVSVSDCRFPNEIETIKKLGGIAVRVIRTDRENYDNHPSETALDNYNNWDYVIQAGSGDIDGLKYRIEQIVEMETK